MTRARWIEVGRILLTGLIALLFWRQWVPLQILWLAVAIGLYPLVKTGVTDLIRERKVGTEIFVTVATLVAVFGGETVAGAVLMVIILIAEFIADLNMDRARASIKTLIGSVPQVALMRGADGERVVPIEQLRAGDVVLVRAGEKIPVDGGIVAARHRSTKRPSLAKAFPRTRVSGQAFLPAPSSRRAHSIFRPKKSAATPPLPASSDWLKTLKHSAHPCKNLPTRLRRG
jgi:hypothetical protein